MENITSIIQNVGFPIACVIFLAYYINKRDNQEQKEREQQRLDNLKAQETRDKRDEQFLESLNNINEFMAQIKTLLKGGDKD